MIRIRIGNRWKGDRKLRGPAVVEEAWDALGIEVEGFDISSGLLEGPLVPTLTSLARAIDRLASKGQRTAQISFSSGIVLLLDRRGDMARLSLVHLARPSRVLVRDVEVDLAALGEAAAASGRELLANLEEKFPKAATVPSARALAEAIATLPLLESLEHEVELGEASHLQKKPAKEEVPTFGFDLRDEDGKIRSYQEGDGLAALLVPGHLYLHGPGGEELVAVPGIPFLLLRDLVASTGALVDPPSQKERTLRIPLGHDGPTLLVDRVGRALTASGRTLRVDPLDLARSVFTAALDLVAVLTSRNPLLWENPYLLDMQEEARARLLFLDELARAEKGIAPAPSPAAPAPTEAMGAPPTAGDLRKVSFRERWRAELGAIRSVHQVDGGAWVAHADGCTLLSMQGGGTQTYAAAIDLAVAGARDDALILEEGGALVSADATGAERWRLETDYTTISNRYVRRGDSAWLVVDGASLVCIDAADGGQRFRLDPPSAYQAGFAASGPLLALCADNGMVYAVDLDKLEVSWRIPLPLRHLAVDGGGVVGIADGAKGPEAVGLANADRSLRFRTVLPVDSVGGLVVGASEMVISAAGAAGGELLGLTPSGELGWRARPVLGPRAPAMVQAGAAIFARGSQGACRIEGGEVRWSMPALPGGAPVILQGMVALPGERLSLREAATGRELLSEAAATAFSPADHLVAEASGRFITCDIHGSCAGLQVAGALAVVPPPP